MVNATFQRTKNGNGYKIVVSGLWMYTSKKALEAVVDGTRTSCVFDQIEDDNDYSKGDDTEGAE